MYRRHLATCPHREKGTDYTACKCPIWCDEVIDGKRVRQSLRTTSWASAEAALNTLMALPAGFRQTLAAPSLPDAIDVFLSELDGRRLEPETIRNYRGKLKAFAKYRQVELNAITVEHVRAYFAGRRRNIEQSTERQDIVIVRMFCDYCISRGWMVGNPTAGLKLPPMPRLRTLPFERKEVQDILDHVSSDTSPLGLEMRALVLTLLYTGLRISDVAQLKRSAYDPRTGYLLLHTLKTGAPVRIKLNDAALRALDALPKIGERFFPSKVGAESTKIKLGKRFRRMSQDLGFRIHAHRFRDTFAVELLTGGADLRTVQFLLGHDSIKTTERHYAHFVREHQRLLDTATDALDFGIKSPVPRIISRNS